MEVGLSYKQSTIRGTYDAIVIGSGMGGLTVAAVLAKHGGKRVLVLERHYTAGGYTHSFTRPGYEWDVGVHYIGQVGEHQQLRPVYDYLTDKRLEWAPMPDVYDRVFLGERAYDYRTGWRRFASKMKEYFPGERHAIDRYLAAVRSCNSVGTPFWADRALPLGVSRVIGPALRMPFLRWAGRTTADVMRDITRNRELTAVLTAQLGDYGLTPSQSSFAIHAAVAAHYLAGAYFPVGGAGAIARSIAPTIERAGGAIYVSAEVERILVEGGRAVGVRMADGRELRAPIVISDAGAANTYGKLLPQAEVPASIREDLRRIGASLGYLCLYIGAKHTDEELGIEGTNLWIYPDADHDGNFARFAADPEAPLPLVYVSFPSAKDPSFRERYPGRSTIDAIVPARYEWFEKWEGTRWMKRGADYDALKERFTKRILDAVFTKVPKLRGKIDVCELSTPVTTHHFAGHPRGELYGLDHTPARYRTPIHTRTHLSGLFITGQDLVSCGVSGAMLGGVLTATAILGARTFPAVMRPPTTNS